MLTELVDALLGLLEQLRGRRVAERELRDQALDAIYMACNETAFYAKEMEGHPEKRNRDTERQLAMLWAKASIPVRHFNPDLADRCYYKSAYWIDPESWTAADVENGRIGLRRVLVEAKELKTLSDQQCEQYVEARTATDTLPPADRVQMHLMRILHELKVPLIAIRGATQFLEEELNHRQLRTQYDYLGDISSWCQLMARLLDNTQLSCRSGRLEMPLNIERTMVYAEVLIPIVRQSRLFLEARHFQPARISVQGFDNLPPVYIDRNRMQQVFFNLLNNAIKYAEDDPETFRVEVEAQLQDERLEIAFRDWGIGIPDGFQNAIFEEGVRAPNAIRKDVSGAGLGLWVVRSIVAAHGGTVIVRSPHQPTTFTIQLPATILFCERR